MHSLDRRIVPYLMRTRNESIVYYEEVIDVTEALAFVDQWNATHAAEAKITIFHVLLASFARGLITRPGLNRFSLGGNVYQRRENTISFVVKKEFKDEGLSSTVKLELTPGESFADMVARIRSIVTRGRDKRDGPVERELKLFFDLPGFMLRWAVWLARKLDSWNLLPYFMMKNDPMYSSMFVANLGSVGVDRVFHHLYEYGTVSLFCAIGEVKKMVFVGPDDTAVVRPGVRLRWSFDERVNDGHYCAESLAIARRHIEHPDWLLGPWPSVQLPGAGENDTSANDDRAQPDRGATRAS